MIKEYFNNKINLSKSINPEEAVAYGAAFTAYKFNQKKKNKIIIMKLIIKTTILMKTIIIMKLIIKTTILMKTIMIMIMMISKFLMLFLFL
jgi:molecular chaperone DnaK (HSP70)